MPALLVDLYETLLWTDWSSVGKRLSSRLEVDGGTLLAAFEATSLDRGLGRHGSVAGDLAALATACGRSAEPTFVNDLADELVSLLLTSVRLFDDVLPTLRRMRQEGVATAIVSNCDHITRPLLQGLGLHRDVDAMILSCEVGCQKPDAPIFHEAMSSLGARPEDCVFIDDQPRFLDGAAALGILSYQIARTPAAKRGVHPIITDLEGITASTWARSR